MFTLSVSSGGKKPVTSLQPSSELSRSCAHRLFTPHLGHVSTPVCVVVFENVCLLVCVLLTCISADVYVLCSSGQQFAQQMQQQNPELIEQLRNQIRNRTPSSSNDEQP